MTDFFPNYNRGQAEIDPYSVPLESLDVSNPHLFARNVHGAWFKRLRDEAPVHFCPNPKPGPIGQ